MSTLKIKDLKGNDKNPRKITEKQYKNLQKTLDELGDLSGIVFNRKNGTLVGGHMRQKVFESLQSKIVITDKLKKSDSQGTLALGYILDGDKKYSYREVEFTEEQHDKAMLVANKAGGEWDFDMLANIWDEEWLENEVGFEKFELTGFYPEDNQNKGNSEIDTDEIEKGLNQECPKCGFKFET